jgi:hypothetical protein
MGRDSLPSEARQRVYVDQLQIDPGIYIGIEAQAESISVELPSGA